ncbi:transport protein particle component [Microthyrium microscopicum]|uniref:Transport protein particle component n=1 Tax=Microthyrium microscopicum TaxID=703497 RepID=A0A6A6UAL1_9PEZI|nr:transport protein particle component [Microthyrium microscopicum]
MAFDTSHTPLSAPADLAGPHVAASCFEFLLIELVPLAYRLTSSQAATESGNGWNPTTTTATSNNNDKSVGKVVSKSGAGSTVGTVGVSTGVGVGGIGGSVEGMDEEETREAVFWRLDGLGYRVGLGIVERFAKDKPRFTDTLDVIKFLCKDLWTLVFKKQIDNLKTNHRGVYVLTDNSFRPLSKMSLEQGREGMMAQAQPFLYFPAGLIRGALASMGIVATVQAESIELPGATFQIRTLAAR